MRNPDRILLVRLSHLGDVVHALGVFHALHGAFPCAEIGWAIQGEFAPLLEGLPGLARVLVFERRGGAAAWLRLRRQLARFRPDWTIDAQGNAKSGAVAWLSRAPRRVAPARSDWQEPWAAWTATEHAPPLRAPARHALERMRALAEHVTDAPCAELRLDVALSPAELERGERALAERLPRTSSAPALLHLSSAEDVRGWPAERWGELVRALSASGRGALVLSGPAEESLGRALERELAGDARVTHWCGQRGLRELAASFAAAARRGLSLVACDSGPMHLAAAHGLRVVALEGPQDAARTGPWPLGTGAEAPLRAPHRVVRSAHALDCAPCLARRCALPEGPLCMTGIGAEDVLAALERTR